MVATYKEPIRGWSDNIYGPTGVIVGAGTGVLRVIQGDPKNYANLVPVDMAVNGLIATAYKISENFKYAHGCKLSTLWSNEFDFYFKRRKNANGTLH